MFQKEMAVLKTKKITQMLCSYKLQLHQNDRIFSLTQNKYALF